MTKKATNLTRARSRSKKHAVFIALDERFADHFCHFAEALTRFWPNHPEVLVALIGECPSLRETISKMERYQIIDSTRLLHDTGPVMEHLNGLVDPRTFYARLILWSNAFDTYDNILHLDVDTLVLAPLDDLLNQDEFLIFEDLYKGKNFLFNDHQDPDLLRLLGEDGIDIGKYQGNAGIFLIPRAYRNKKQLIELRALMKRYRGHLRWADQSLINVWLRKMGCKISRDLRWNFQARAFANNSFDFRTARILHLNGVPDPQRPMIMELALALLKRPYGREVLATAVMPHQDLNPVSLRMILERVSSTLHLPQPRYATTSMVDPASFLHEEAA